MSRRVQSRSPEHTDAAAASTAAISTSGEGGGEMSMGTRPATEIVIHGASTPRRRSPRPAADAADEENRISIVPLPSFGAPFETECPRCGVPMAGSLCPLCLFDEQDPTTWRARERLQSEPTRLLLSSVQAQGVVAMSVQSLASASAGGDSQDLPTSTDTGAKGTRPPPTTWGRSTRPRSRSSPPANVHGVDPGRLSPDEADLFYVPTPLEQGPDDNDSTTRDASRTGSGESRSGSSSAQSHTPSPSPPATVRRFTTRPRAHTHTLSHRHRHTRSRSAHLFDSISMNTTASTASLVTPNTINSSNATAHTHSRVAQLQHLRARRMPSRDFPPLVVAPSPLPAPIPRYRNHPSSSVITPAHTPPHSTRSTSTAPMHIPTAPSSPEPRPDPDFDSTSLPDTDALLFAQPIPDVAYFSPSTPSDTDFRSISPPSPARSVQPSPAPSFDPLSASSYAISDPTSIRSDSHATPLAVTPVPSPRTTAAQLPLTPHSRSYPSPKISIPATPVASQPSPGASALLGSPSVRSSRLLQSGGPLSPPPVGPLPPTPTAVSPRNSLNLPMTPRERVVSSPTRTGYPTPERSPASPTSPQTILQRPQTAPSQKPGHGSTAGPSSSPKYAEYIARKSAEQEARIQRLAALATAAEADHSTDTERELLQASSRPREQPVFYHSDTDATAGRPYSHAQASASRVSQVTASRTGSRSPHSRSRAGSAPKPGALALAHLNLLPVPTADEGRTAADRRTSVQSARSSRSGKSPRASGAYMSDNEPQPDSRSMPPSPNARVEFSPTTGIDMSPTSRRRHSGSSRRHSGTSSSGAKRFSLASMSLNSRSRKNSVASAHTRHPSSQYAIPMPPIPVPELPRRLSHGTSAPSTKSRSSTKVKDFFRTIGRAVTGQPAASTSREPTHDVEHEHEHAVEEAETASLRTQARARARQKETEPPPPPKRRRSIVARLTLDRGRSRSHDLLRSADGHGEDRPETRAGVSAVELAMPQGPTAGRARSKTWLQFLRPRARD